METSDQKAIKLKKSEREKINYHKKRENDQSILKKAIDLLSQNREMSLDENEILRQAEAIKARRLRKSDNSRKYRQNRKTAATPEEVEALRMKRIEQVRRSIKKRKAEASPAEKEAMRLKKIEQTRHWSQNRKALATPEKIEAMRLKRLEQCRKYRHDKQDKEESILNKAVELLSQNRKLSLEENDIVRKAEDIKARRLKRNQVITQYFRNRKTAVSPEEVVAMRSKNLEKVGRSRQNRKAVAIPEETMTLKNSERDRRQNQKNKEKDSMQLKRAAQKRQYRKKRLERESILRTAKELLNQNQLLSIEEEEILSKADEVKALRLRNNEYYNRFIQKQKAADTPEEMEAKKLKRLEQVKRSIQKRRAEATPEELEAMRLRTCKQVRRYRQNKMAVSTPEEVEAMRLKHSEQSRNYYQEKRDKEELILKKATELLSQNQELSLEEKHIVRKAEEIKAKRLKRNQVSKHYSRKRKANATHEELKAMRLRNMEHLKRFHQNRKAATRPEEVEAMRLKHLEKARKYCQERRDKDKSILKRAMELLGQNGELSLEENEIVRKAEEIRAKQLKRRQYVQKRRAAATNAELEAKGLLIHAKQSRQYQQNKREIGESILTQATEFIRQNQETFSDEKEADKIKMDKLRKSGYGEHIKQFKKQNASGKLRTDQIFDEIKIEKEVLQETKINAIAALQNSNLVQNVHQGVYNDSSCSWFELPQKTFMTGENSKNHSYFQSWIHAGSSSKQFDRRKLGLAESFRCMRELIDATAKGDGHAIFGKQIAQKLRSSKKNVEEVNIAKQLIDDILQNLGIGVYSFQTEIV